MTEKPKEPRWAISYPNWMIDELDTQMPLWRHMRRDHFDTAMMAMGACFLAQTWRRNSNRETPDRE